LAGPYERGEMEAATEQMITVQTAIEAIDAALADDRESSVPASGPSREHSAKNGPEGRGHKTAHENVTVVDSAPEFCLNRKSSNLNPREFRIALPFDIVEFLGLQSRHSILRL
jgi:hypothetical protein